MPKVTGPLFSVDARGGLFGTIVYSIWKGVNYVRELTVPTNPNTPRQSLVRGFLTTAVRAWGSLTSAQRTSWIDYAKTIILRNAMGTEYNPTGINAYTALSTIAQDEGQTPVDLPPSTDAPGALTGAAITGGPLEGEIVVDWTGTDGDFGDVWLTRLLSPGESPQANLYRHLSYTAIATQTLLITDLVGGGKYSVQVRATRNNGQVGPFTIEILTATV